MLGELTLLGFFPLFIFKKIKKYSKIMWDKLVPKLEHFEIKQGSGFK